MSNFTGRRAPNVSAYLANLNTIPSHEDQAAQSDFTLDDGNLDYLSTAEFFDFDLSVPAPVDFQQHAPQPPQQPQNNAQMTGMFETLHTPHATTHSLTPTSGPGYQFSEFQTFPHSLAESPNNIAPSPTSGLQGPYPPQANHFVQPGDKRKASAANLAPVADLEEQSRFAAEEDKRRRNTAASARFRVKKKQREAALEKQSKEMTDKVTALENRINQLEMENKWLKGLITEKSDVKGMEEQFKKFAAERKTQEEEKEAHRSTELRTDGVGTESPAPSSITA
jgi:hypothetical protein